MAWQMYGLVPVIFGWKCHVWDTPSIDVYHHAHVLLENVSLRHADERCCVSSCSLLLMSRSILWPEYRSCHAIIFGTGEGDTQKVDSARKALPPPQHDSSSKCWCHGPYSLWTDVTLNEAYKRTSVNWMKILCSGHMDFPQICVKASDWTALYLNNIWQMKIIFH
jgi:hypothetical protein